MRRLFISFLFLASSSCTTAQAYVDRTFADDLGFERLYGSDAVSVYYDPVAMHCVAYAIVLGQNGGGVGLDTFPCDPAELRERAKRITRQRPSQ